ncbi:CheB Chemotaxis response regulator containing a CheY-like receiver domain and a methylesterase domain [Burkholderiaceae bacterium]|jgi:two-component system chemotaxis response regulator CheB
MKHIISPKDKIRVLIVDDSAVMRRIIMTTLLRHADIEVVGTAEDGLEAIEMIERIKPDLITLDVEMPKMDGLTALKEIRKLDRDLPIIMFSSLTQRGGEATITALTNGASDYVGKPSDKSNMAEALRVLEDELIPKIRELCKPTQAKPSRIIPPKEIIAEAKQQIFAKRSGLPSSRIEALCIGVSTGGPAALMELFAAWQSPLSVPIFIVQHMPPKFTELLATRLTSVGVIPVVEAQHGQEAIAGKAYIAPGGKHLELRKSGAKVVMMLNEDPPENSCRPAVDVLFRSAAKIYGGHLLALVLTGMGYDGLKGAVDIVNANGRVLVQDEETSVIWGMPGAIANANLAEKILPLSEIPNEVVFRTQRK